MLFELDISEYNVHSLRRGGATAFFAQSGSMDKTMITGRWEHASSARIYINEATAQASKMRLTQTKHVCSVKPLVVWNRFKRLKPGVG